MLKYFKVTFTIKNKKQLTEYVEANDIQYAKRKARAMFKLHCPRACIIKTEAKLWKTLKTNGFNCQNATAQYDGARG